MNNVRYIDHLARTLAVIAALGLPSIAATAGDDFPPANDVAVALYRLDPTSGASWAMTIIARLDFVSGVTGVEAQVPAGPSIDLDPSSSDPPQWSATQLFATVDEAVAAAHGMWTIDVAGSAPSSTEFSITADSLDDSDFFDFPVITTPAFGATVPADTNFVWIDPTGSETAEAIAIEVNSPGARQYVDTFIGPITVDSTTWNPPEFFEVGELSVAGLFYVRFGDATPYVVTSGSIRWNDASGVPSDYPAQTPRFTYGSAAVVPFNVTDAKGGPGDLNGDGVVSVADLIQLLGAWGPCEGCVEDIDGDGNVGVSDLLIVLANWG